MPRYIHRSFLDRSRTNQFNQYTKIPRPSAKEELSLFYNQWKGKKAIDEHSFIIFMDLIGVKAIHESFGYEMGEEVLNDINQILRDASPDECQWIQLGSNIFVCLITGFVLKDTVEELIYDWKTLIEAPIFKKGFEFRVTAVFGASFSKEHGESFSVLMKSADAALRQSKQLESSVFQWYNPMLSENKNSGLSIEDQLRNAIYNKEFELYYQPQWNVHKETWGGLEVLVRWRHPDRGLISPARFIDIAEETGLIHPLGDWIIEKASEENAARLRDFNIDIPLSINFSNKQLMTPNYLEKLMNLLKRCGLPPNNLVMELTESVAADAERTKALLSEAGKQGIKISIDDFGTGYSSLSYLRELPVDELKIDRSFIVGVENDQTGKKELLQWIIHLGKVLDVSIVAEGVETKEQSKLLKNWGCDTLQGFYYSEPLSAEKIISFLKNNEFASI